MIYSVQVRITRNRVELVSRARFVCGSRKEAEVIAAQFYGRPHGDPELLMHASVEARIGRVWISLHSGELQCMQDEINRVLEDEKPSVFRTRNIPARVPDDCTRAVAPLSDDQWSELLATSPKVSDHDDD